MQGLHRTRRVVWLGGIVACGLLAVAALGMPRHAAAQYVGNNLIDDTIFLNAASMTQSQIQTFLQNRGGYLAAYSAFSGRDNATVPASQIIYEAAQDYGMNPQVVLATLQKEESLVTDPSPLSSQLNFAMGYGCGDLSGCSQYSGFYSQVDNGTWQLRFNFERARGNNSWWNPNTTYACVTPSTAPPYSYPNNKNPHFYYPGLLPGNNVTFYDGFGTPYQTFVINNNATASLYCYTPHAYPGSSADYYSGSYNFVAAFEQWFGSTQPAVEVSSPLRVTDLPQGNYTNSPITVSFDLTNSTGSPIDVGGMAVAVRDAENNNHDYMLKDMTVPAHSTVTYTDSQVFISADTYTMWITNFANSAWSDTTPPSANIDNTRRVVIPVQAMPTLTIQPTANVTDMRQGKSTQFTFTVVNGSQTAAINLGDIALAVRAPDGSNVDLPGVVETIPAGGSYVYSQTLVPQMAGTYTAWVTDTTDNGVNWNETNFPANGPGVQRRITFTVNPSPTVTQGPTLSVLSPRVGQQVVTSFKVKNFGDSGVSVGVVGMAIRDPQGRNVDAGAINLTVAANTEYTFQANATFQTPGTYTAWITDTRDGGRTWDDTTYPTVESGSVQRRVTFTVLPSPTITVQPTITTADPRVGKAVSATFTIHNYGSQALNAGQLALACRDPNGKNVDFVLQSVTIPAGSDYVYTASNPGTVLTTPGTYTAWITDTRDGGRTWDDTTYPTVESGSVQRRVTFTVKASPTITQGPTLSVPSPHVGQQVTASFAIHNYGDQAFSSGAVGMAIYDPNGRNVGLALQSLTIPSQSDLSYQQSTTFQTPGTYTAWITYTVTGTFWDNSTFPTLESGSIQRKITFVVQP